MSNVSYVSLSQQVAMRRLMEVTANNIANMSTPGFKAQNIMFREYVSDKDKSGHKISQVEDYGTYRDLSQGPLLRTENTLDVAINGEGYFSIQTDDGVRYTRDGAFTLNANGEIVTKDGFAVLDDAGNGIKIQQGAAQITIADDGSVSTEKGQAGKMKIVTFGKPQYLTPEGRNLYDANGALEGPMDEKTRIVQGMLENSNVEPIIEMNKLIEITRMYQATQNMIITNHDQERSLIEKMTRV